MHKAISTNKARKELAGIFGIKNWKKVSKKAVEKYFNPTEFFGETQYWEKKNNFVLLIEKSLKNFKLKLTKNEAIETLKELGLTSNVDLNLYFDKSGENFFTKKYDFDNLFELRTFVKERIKSKVKKYYGKSFEEIIPQEQKRLEIYKKAWELRKLNGSKLANNTVVEFLIKEIGHWSPKNKGHNLCKRAS